MYISLVIEDDVHLNIVKKVIAESAPGLYVGKVLGRRGNSYIKDNVRSFNEASKIVPYVIITDLDAFECPLSLINEWITFKKHSNFYFNIAVQEAEAWLLADRKTFSAYLGVPEALIDLDPEAIDNPKRYIVNIARKSKNRTIREGLVPQGTAKVGKLYNTILGEYIYSFWSVSASAKNSKSLSRFIAKLKRINK